MRRRFAQALNGVRQCELRSGETLQEVTSPYFATDLHAFQYLDQLSPSPKRMPPVRGLRAVSTP